MTYTEAKEVAMNIAKPEEVDTFLKSIELNNNITDRQYYNLKHIALESAYAEY